MRLRDSIVVSVPPQEVWSYLSDLDNYRRFMHGVTRWEAEGDQHSGLGARRRMLIRAGSTEVGGVIEIVEWDPPGDLAWTSVLGVDQRGRIRVRPVAGGRASRVEMRFAYGVAGAGLFGWIAEKVAAPTLRRHLRDTLTELKREVEHERLRAAAAGATRARA